MKRFERRDLVVDVEAGEEFKVSDVRAALQDVPPDAPVSLFVDRHEARITITWEKKPV